MCLLLWTLLIADHLLLVIQAIPLLPKRLRFVMLVAHGLTHAVGLLAIPEGMGLVIRVRLPIASTDQVHTIAIYAVVGTDAHQNLIRLLSGWFCLAWPIAHDRLGNTSRRLTLPTAMGVL